MDSDVYNLRFLRKIGCFFFCFQIKLNILSPKLFCLVIMLIYLKQHGLFLTGLGCLVSIGHQDLGELGLL